MVQMKIGSGGEIGGVGGACVSVPLGLVLRSVTSALGLLGFEVVELEEAE